MFLSLECTCGKLNSVDVILERHSQLTMISEQNQAMSSKELSAELRDRIVALHRETL